MVIAGRSASLALLLSFALAVADAIRLLKEGPMIDAEGREYKSGIRRFGTESIRGPQLGDGSTVHVQCRETSMLVMVKADLYNNGRLVSPGEVSLGEAELSQSSRCRAVAAGDGEYVIEAGLQDCGTELTISEDFVIYSNKLVISPASSYHGITRTTGAVVPVSCHYKRTHLVSSNVQQPPLTLSAKHSTGPSDFSLRLMNDDWTSETSSRLFHLGDLLHLEASYTGPDAGRRRLFINNCVATLSPDPTSVPRYYFVENHGCLTDAKEAGSETLFRPRTRADSLQLQLNAFLFDQDSRNSIFLTCQLKAAADMWWSSPTKKTCNYVHSRWKNVDGSDDVCQCCNGSCCKSSYECSSNTNLRPVIPADMTVCGTVSLGPLMISHIK